VGDGGTTHGPDRSRLTPGPWFGVPVIVELIRGALEGEGQALNVRVSGSAGSTEQVISLGMEGELAIC